MADSDNSLAELIEISVEPIVRCLIRSRLHVSLRTEDERQVSFDAQELVSEIKTTIVAKLIDLKSQTGSGRIDNLEAYVRTVSSNACNQYLRKKYPNRLRLKNQLRYLLTHDRRFSLWNTENDDWICGLADWRDGRFDREALDHSEASYDQLRARLENRGFLPDLIDLVELVEAVFDHRRRPLRFSELIETVYGLRRISEPVHLPEDEVTAEHSTEKEASLLDRLEHKSVLKALWEEIGQLPLRHRAALLLNLKDRHGDGLITLLPIARIASIRQIAEMLEFPIDKFAKIWNDLPWDDRAISEHLGLTRQQVINLRQSARATLKRRMDQA